MSISSSMASLVVPAIWLTIAFSSFNKAFNKVDFPTLGSPTIATGIPFFNTFPKAKESISRFKTALIFSTSRLNSALSANSTSSSAKSSSNSIKLAKLSSCSRKFLISLLNPPRICCKATWCEAAEFEEIKSATASAWVRSIFPFKKARSVNSPALAFLAPFLRNN